MSKKITYGDLRNALNILYMLGENDEIATAETVDELIEILETNRYKEIEI